MREDEGLESGGFIKPDVLADGVDAVGLVADVGVGVDLGVVGLGACSFLVLLPPILNSFLNAFTAELGLFSVLEVEG